MDGKTQPALEVAVTDTMELSHVRLRSSTYIGPINMHDLSVDVDQIISVLSQQYWVRCTSSRLKSCVLRESSKELDPYQLANGHDVSAILGIALRKIFGKRRESHTWASEIEAGLRLTFSREDLSQTKIFQIMKKWEFENKSYRIFPP